MLILVQIYGDNTMNKTAVYKWVKRFSEGRESVTDEERSGHPTTSRTEENIAKVRQIVPSLHCNHISCRIVLYRANI